MKSPTAAVLAAGILLAAFVSFAAVGFARYLGTGIVFVVFNLCFFALVGLIFPKPRLYTYTFLTVFLALGFWAKVVVHAIWAPGFVEPVGDFANTPKEWDSALVAASCAALGIIVVRCGHLWHAWNSRETPEPHRAVPNWFVRWRRPIWIASIVLLVAVNAANLEFAFFQIGVNPNLLLPMRMHVVLGWLVNIGFAMWVAALLWWDYRLDRSTVGKNLFMPMIESLLSSVSAFSRIAFILHAAPYALALLERRVDLSQVITRRWLGSLISCCFVLFVASILAVFWLRETHYYQPQHRNVRSTISSHLPNLLVHRWVGIEGLLTVGAMKDRGTRLLIEAVTESPKLAGRSLYQRSAKVKYLADYPETFTFLANAGPVAILLFSGSLAIVFLGMAIISLLLFVTEEIMRWSTGNPFLLAVSGAALANVVSQTTFFYLTGIFLLQMWVAVGFLAIMQRWPLGHTQARRVL